MLKKLTFFLAFVAFSCTYENNIELDRQFNAESLQVNQVYSKVVVENNREKLVYHFKFDLLQKDEMVPREMYFDGNPFLDNGRGHDQIAGDGIYTSLHSFETNDKSSLKEKTYFDRYAPEPSNGWYIKCDFEIAGVGGDCLGEKCPETSILG